MPLLAINLSDKLFLAIKELVEKGNYQSPESFIGVLSIVVDEDFIRRRPLP